MTSLHKKIVVAAASVAALVVILLPIAWRHMQGQILYGMRETQRELERQIAQDVAPKATVKEVVRYLDANHIEHGQLERLTEYDSDTRNYAIGTPMIRAIKRRTASGLIGFQSLRIIFIFSEDQHLARFSVEPIYTAP